MKRIYLLVVLCFSMLYVTAQELESFNQERLTINKSGMLVLGSWALANIAMSPIFASRSTGWEKSFHQMNGYWNGVNLIIAGFGYYSATQGDFQGLSLAETFSEQHSMEKILLFNAGLDIGYIATGLYLQERAKTATKKRDQLKGFGRSVMLQGGFLFLFDVGFYLVQHYHSSVLYNMAQHISMSPGGFSLAFTL